MARSSKVDTWNSLVLGDILTVHHGFPFEGSQFNYEGDGLPVFTPANFEEDGGFRPLGAAQKYSRQDCPREYIVSNQEILVVMTEQAPGLLGSPAGVPIGQTFLHNQRLGRIEILDENRVDVKFVYHLFNDFRVRKQISATAAGTKVRHSSPSRIQAVSVKIPPLAEQKSIAAVLSAWDRAIGQASALIAAKERLKQGLMQQLLSGQRRFRGLADGQWHEHYLGDLFDERDERGYVDLPLLSITADRGVIPRSEIDRKDNSNEDKSLYKRIMPGDIGYNTMRMWQGVSAVSSLMGIVSPAYTVCIPKSQIHSDFAAYIFKHLPMVHLFHRYSQGLVNDTLNLKFRSFAKIQLRIPGKHEQHKIVETFGCIDEDIRLLNKTLDRTKRQKRGLMQQLLTGRVRVPKSLLRKGAKS